MNKRTVALLIIPIILLGSVLGYAFYNYHSTVQNGASNNHQLLFVLIDDTEGQAGGGPGAVDMAYILNFTDGKLTNTTPIYPGDMQVSNNISAPPDVPSETHLHLVDSFYWSNLTQDSQYAQEIVQQSTGIKTDGVVILKPAAVDAIIQAVGPITINGTLVNGTDVNGSVEDDDAITYVRSLQYEHNMSRGNSVDTLAEAIENSANNNTKLPGLLAAITTQYSKGNIIVIPPDLFNQMVTDESLSKIFGT